MANSNNPIQKTEQSILNNSYDTDFNQLATEKLGYDGTNLQRGIADNLATKITKVGTITYIGIAAPGVSQATTKWQAQKIDTTDTNNIIISWADNANFSQAATDLTILTYT